MVGRNDTQTVRGSTLFSPTRDGERLHESRIWDLSVRAKDCAAGPPNRESRLRRPVARRQSESDKRRIRRANGRRLSTGKIELSTGVTNSLTRHASVTAASIATLQMESGGRAVCGIGRGNTAAYQIGMKPDGLDHFERYLVALKSYLHGEPVDSAGRENRLEWLDVEVVPHVPLEVAVSGPKVLGIAARHADRISLAVGGDPVFVSMWLARAQAAVVAAGRDPSSVRYGAYVPVFVNDDLTIARQCVRFIAGHSEPAHHGGTNRRRTSFGLAQTSRGRRAGYA